jgi:hypothetical protein
MGRDLKGKTHIPFEGTEETRKKIWMYRALVEILTKYNVKNLTATRRGFITTTSGIVSIRTLKKYQ